MQDYPTWNMPQENRRVKYAELIDMEKNPALNVIQ
jgi:hypothetical protein